LPDIRQKWYWLHKVKFQKKYVAGGVPGENLFLKG
jgi:hypothetical protein